MEEENTTSGTDLVETVPLIPRAAKTVERKPPAIRWEKYFDGIYLIHLRDYRERFANIKAELTRVGIWDCPVFKVRYTFKSRWSKVLDRDSVKWSYMSGKGELVGTPSWSDLSYNTLAVINESQELGYGRILILEDDIVFLKDLGAILKFLDSMPDEYDLLQFEYFNTVDGSMAALDESSVGKWVHGGDFFGGGCYSLSRTGMDKMRLVFDNFLAPTDRIFRFPGLKWNKWHTSFQIATQLNYSGHVTPGQYNDNYNKSVWSVYNVPGDYDPRKGIPCEPCDSSCSRTMPVKDYLGLRNYPRSMSCGEDNVRHVCYAIGNPVSEYELDMLVMSVDSLRRSSHDPSRYFIHVLACGGMDGLPFRYAPAFEAFRSRGGFAGFEFMDASSVMRLFAGRDTGDVDESAFKYLVPYLLGPDVSEALFLSCGSIVLQDLSPLFNEDLYPFPVGAPPGYDVYMYCGDLLNSWMNDASHRDNGVVLMDLAKCRDSDMFDKARAAMSKGSGRISGPPLSEVFPDSVSFLPPNYSSPLLFHAIFRDDSHTVKTVEDAEARFRKVFSATRYSSAVLGSVILRMNPKHYGLYFSMPHVREIVWDRLEAAESFADVKPELITGGTGK